MKKFAIGVDIGGTNTDAVLIAEGDAILCATKTPTTPCIVDGFSTAIRNVIEKVEVKSEDLSGIFVGTTHATNALLQGQDLYRVGVLRLSGQSGHSVLTACDWPKDTRKIILAGSISLPGGFYCDGRPLEHLDEDAIAKAAVQLLAAGMESLVIIGVYSSLNDEQEHKAASIIRKILGEYFPITLSSTIGGPGFLERENASILNASLKKSITSSFAQLSSVLTVLNLSCPLYLTQNNGTILSLEDALKYPVLTISAGPTNSFIGASKLAGLENAIVADIGGTSTDVGIVLNGFARRSVGSSMIAGIKLNFQMPDIQSIASGGGSKIEINNDTLAIGPESVAKNITNQAQAFGGSTLTLTDIAVLHGAKIEGADPSKIRCKRKDVLKVLDVVNYNLQMLRKKIGGIQSRLPLILVGGGAELLRGTFIADKCIIPESAGVANAFGAALAEVSGVIDTVVCLKNRDEVLAGLRTRAVDKAVKQGACLQTVRLIEQQIIPFQYLSDPLARVRIMVAGKRSS